MVSRRESALPTSIIPDNPYSPPGGRRLQDRPNRRISMPRKVILDVDPGIDDALALAIALSDPSLDVVAVTAVGGNVPPATATRNVQAIVEQIDPPKLPRIGAASDPDEGLPPDGRYLHGSDGFGGAGIEVAELRTPHPSEKLICDAVRADPNSVTIVALGTADQHRPRLSARSRTGLPGRPGSSSPAARSPARAISPRRPNSMSTATQRPRRPFSDPSPQKRSFRST